MKKFINCVLILLINVQFVINYVIHNNKDDDHNIITAPLPIISSVIEVNKSSEPCDDFYEFVCDDWISKNSLKPNQLYMNQFQYLQDKVDNQLKEILEKNENGDELAIMRSTRSFYSTCLVQSDQLNQLTSLLSDFGGWPMTVDDNNWDDSKFDLLSVMTGLIRQWSVAPLLNIFVAIDRMNTSESILYVDQPTSLIPRTMLVQKVEYSVHIKAYQDYIASCAFAVTKYVDRNTSAQVIDKHVSDILNFEIELAKLTGSLEMRTDKDRMYNKMSLWNLQKLTDSVSNTFRIDWYKLINEILNDTNISIEMTDEVVIKEIDYLTSLIGLLSNTSSVTLSNYMLWNLVSSLSGDINEEFDKLLFNFEKVFLGTTEPEKRWKKCLDYVNTFFPFAIGYNYIQKYFDKESKNEVEKIVENVIDSYGQQLQRSDWLDKGAKNLYMEKLTSLKKQIAYPDWYLNESALSAYYEHVNIGKSHFENLAFLKRYNFKKSLMKIIQPTDLNEWSVSPVIVNAFYDDYTNTIVLPAAILQKPFYDRKQPLASNYGSIGSIIGHEIAHSFDEPGKFGTWSENMIQQYEKKTQCFYNQYNKMSNVSGTNNALNTKTEDIADNYGLKQSYYAFQRLSSNVNNPSPISQYTNGQLFFISYAQTWCETVSKSSLLYDLLNGVHSVQKTRVIVSLANLPQFSFTFNCKINSQMNPIHKCSLW